MRTLSINHAAVWVSVILLTALGFLWYGPLFGDSWMAMIGLDKAAVEANPPGAAIWISNVVATVIPLYALGWLFTQLKVESALKGAAYGLLIGFAFVFLSNLTGNLFAQRPYGLSWIEGGYSMVALALAGLVLGAWRRYPAAA